MGVVKTYIRKNWFRTFGRESRCFFSAEELAGVGDTAKMAR